MNYGNILPGKDVVRPRYHAQSTAFGIGCCNFQPSILQLAHHLTCITYTYLFQNFTSKVLIYEGVLKSP